ncbi:MAG: DinB family protein [Pirellulales bacterium]|nr:DinB family protein [Planctomycetales bacterium]
MQSKDLIRLNLDLAQMSVLPLIEDMVDAPLTAPTPNGGNHPLWVLGHLTYSEGSLVQAIMLGNPHPLAEWKDLFGIGSTPVYDESEYPAMREVLDRYRPVRAATLEVLDGLDEKDLDRESAACPENRREVFGTYRHCLAMVANHWFMHRGQVADARRAAGRGTLRS